MAKITIIVPVYNAGRFLDECIASILSQTFGDFRLILSDDGSTDASPEICDRYARADRRVTVIHAANGGFSVARNRALDMADTEWVFFVDADDAISPDALERLLAESDGADAVRGAFSYTRPAGGAPTARRVYTGLEAIEATLYRRPHMPSAVWGTLFRLALFGSDRFKPGIGYEDLELLHRLYPKAAKVVYVDTCIYLYRQHPDSYIHIWQDSRADVLDVTERIESDYADMPALHRAARDRRLSAAFNIFALCVRNGGAPRIADRCWHTIRTCRAGSLFNAKVRLRNKAAVALSLVGRRAFAAILRCYSLIELRSRNSFMYWGQ